MKKIIFGLGAVVLVGIAVFAGYVYHTQLRGIGPALRKPPADISEIIEDYTDTTNLETQNTTDFPLTLPPGFTIGILADGLPGVRDMVLDKNGDMWVTQTSEGKVVYIDIENGNEIGRQEVLTDLNKPHGLAYDAEQHVLYIAEENQIVQQGLNPNEPLLTIAQLPEGGRHYTRSLVFTSDKELLVSIGSTCDVCFEDDDRHGTIMKVNIADQTLEPYAKGLRNSVFMAVNPQTGDVWATEMGRDMLGDDLPPDELNIVEQGNDYGWPLCYGKNIHDTNFDTQKYTEDPCANKIPSTIDLPAHVAPLGLSFIEGDGWPMEWHGDLLVALHGSWNRSDPVGYKVIRVSFDTDRQYRSQQDFISGWLTDDNRALGRPVDIEVSRDGGIYISDDKAGVIYQVRYTADLVTDNCNIEVSSPRPNEQVGNVITVTGRATPCWNRGGVSVVDDENNYVSAFFINYEPYSSTSNQMNPFSLDVELREVPTSRSGKVIIESSNEVSAYSIPVIFSDDAFIQL